MKREKSKISRGSLIREFLLGVVIMLKSLLWVLKRPKQIGRGILPAIISIAILGCLLVIYLLFLKPLVRGLSGFTKDWEPWLATATQIAMGAGLTAAVVFLLIASFTAIALIVGDSFYTKIWKDYELSQNNIEIQDSYEPSFAEGLQDALTIFFKGLGISLITLLLAFIPIVGSVIAAVVGFTLTGYMLSFELMSRSMGARYFNISERKVLQRQRKAMSLGYGLTTQALILIPFGALLAIPVSMVASAKFASQLQSDANSTYPEFLVNSGKRVEEVALEAEEKARSNKENKLNNSTKDD